MQQKYSLIFNLQLATGALPHDRLSMVLLFDKNHENELDFFRMCLPVIVYGHPVSEVKKIIFIGEENLAGESSLNCHVNVTFVFCNSITYC